MPEPTDRPEVTDVESALRGLRPHAELDRCAVLYRAGRASVRGNWIWPLAAVLSTSVGVVLGWLLLTRPAAPTVERIVERIVYLPAPPRQEPAPPLPPESSTTPATSELSAVDGYFGPQSVRDHVLRWGLDGLPPAPNLGPIDPSETPASLFHSQ
jgi:hypothetical protein